MTNLKVRKLHYIVGVCALFFFSSMVFPTHTMAQNSARIVWYNVENLFDTIDNPETNDNQFLPTSKLQWDENKYGLKVKNIGRVLSAAGGWGTPAIIGLAEIENSSVVEDVIKRNPALRKTPYGISVTRGRDGRGINVALIWDTRLFKAINLREIPNTTPRPNSAKKSDVKSYPISKVPKNIRSRSMLWATLITKRTVVPDTLDIFVVHAPSRRGGVKASEHNRIYSMQNLRGMVDEVIKKRGNPKIVIMGDFNDSPTDKSIVEALGANTNWHSKNKLSPTELYNMSDLHEKQSRGSHSYKGKYWMPDQIIVSGSLIETDGTTRFKQRNVQIFSPPFIKNSNGTPKRAILGNHFRNGYSDHFPIYIDLEY